MLLHHLIALAALTGVAIGFPTAVTHVLHEKRTSSASAWVKGARVESSAILPIRIGLTQTNLEHGYEQLMKVSSHDSEDYGRYWTAKQVHDFFAPAEEAEEAIKEWLTTSGIHHSRIMHYENKGWLGFDATTEEAESLFLTEFHEHGHMHSDRVRVGCDSYHVPKHVQDHIDFITPGIKLVPLVKRDVKVKREPKVSKVHAGWDGEDWNWKPPRAWGLPPDLQGCGRNITPACIKALYLIPDATLSSPGNSLGLIEQGDYFSKTDLDLFFAQYAPYVPQGTYPIPALIDGAQYSVPIGSALNGGESDIDISMAYSLIYPQTVTLYQVDDQIYESGEVDGPFLYNTFLDALDGSYCGYTAYGETGDDPSVDPIYPDPAAGGYKGQRQCGVFTPTNVISASTGDYESDLPIKYSYRQCNEFMKLGMRGHSILVASGDYGVASFPGDGDANGCLGPEGKIFNPQYPGNCPYITAVGATMLYPDQTVLDPESVMHINLTGTMQNFTSSGGFSNYYAQPPYQQAAVAEYFANNNPPYPYYSELEVNLKTTKGLYNRIGRGNPDVAANGVNFRVFIGESNDNVNGASLSSPLFASVLTLINEERYQIGKGPVGFVNTVLYAHPGLLNDITNGTNVGCGTQGFPAATGWDPATGLGTPNYPKMLAFYMSLP